MVQRQTPAKIERKGAGEPRKRRMDKVWWSKKIDHAQIDRSFPNYMKPTSCSDARKQQRQVSDRAAPASTPVRVSRRKMSSKSLKISQKKVNRATCSSTLKDSKFPESLELTPGATEAEGTSVVRVCPYKYCSLNGHLHDDLPPLKCFLASRRKVMQAHKCMKHKGVSPFRKRGSGRDLDTGQGVCRSRCGLEITSLIEEIGSDFFIEIYAKPQERLVESVNCDESLSELQEDETVCPDESLNDDVDQSSEFTVDDLEVVMHFLEFVSCDQEVEEEKEKLPSSIEEEHVQGNGEAVKQTHILESVDINLGDEADHPFADYKSNFSDDGLDPRLGKLFENDDDDLSCNFRNETISALSAVSEEKVEPSVVIDQDGSISSEGQVFESVTMDFDPVDADEISEKIIWMYGNEENATNETAELSVLPEVHLPTSTELDDEFQIDAGVSGDTELIESNLDINDSLPPTTAQTSEGKVNKKKATIRSSTDDDGSDPNLRMIITRKARNDELEQSTEFNMRSPNFLPEHPGPETEQVDLKHQMMDERKNSEEWMIDYALQQAVSKLGPARRQKVALLVEAFETVIPVPACEKPLRDGTQSFSNSRPLQVCAWRRVPDSSRKDGTNDTRENE